jgi:2-succinyl-5-enolpyruvyl-6-hydroxy-3-cyclohexene-1-carboxylate synthase
MLRGVPVVVIVLNNDGGGIFSFLPVARHKEFFEPYFGTPQGVGFGPAAEMFGLGYEQPHTTDAFLSAYASACARGVSSILEVRTDREENVRLHAELLRVASGYATIRGHPNGDGGGTGGREE